MKRLYIALSVMYLSLQITPLSASAAPIKADPEFDEILALDISQLTVTSVTRSEKKLSDTASAVYVITNEDIRRSGATSIPEALRGAPGIEVAQVASNKWSVASRGFNQTLSNKLLVMIDGRTIYTPIFSGVYWDDKSIMLEDVERIEIVRGPGASLWGANAVNGVINIISKKAQDTEGVYLSQSFGTEVYSTTEGRIGRKINDDTSYRVYALNTHRGKTDVLATDKKNVDDWYRLRSGFRVDNDKKEGDSFTFQGDVYGGEQGTMVSYPLRTAPYSVTEFSQDDSLGGNILGRWNHEISPDSKTSLQVYLDHYFRDERVAQQNVLVGDIDFQHNLKLDDRNAFTWGANYRYVQDELDGTVLIARFREPEASYQTISAFFQNEYEAIADKLFLTVGSKFEHNDFTGFEFQPNVRAAYKLEDNQTVWAAASRAVRIPSRVEDDLNLAVLATQPSSPGAPTNLFAVFGNPALDAEELIAYEIGHRIQLSPQFSVDSTAFYNTYDKLATIEPNGAPYISTLSGALVIPYIQSDLGNGHVYGFEVAANWAVNDKWRLNGSYTFSQMDLEAEPGSISNPTTTERRSPNNQFAVKSYYNITPEIRFDNFLYYVQKLNAGTARIPSYVRFDTSIGWHLANGVELSLVGSNLLDDKHPEFSGSPTAEIERSVIGKVTWRF